MKATRALSGHPTRRDQTDRLLSFCWCQRTTAHIPAAMVARGETVSCGRDGCGPEVMEEGKR